MYEVIPVCQIRHDCLVLYDFRESGGRRSDSNSHFDNKGLIGLLAQDTDNDTGRRPYSGEMTAGSVKRMKKAIDALISIAEWKTVKHPTKDYNIRFKLNFITLTLPAPQRDIKDKDITRKALQPLLEWVKDHYPRTSYIWKAETQENGNIHYHLTTDSYIPHDQLKRAWNQKLKKFGLIRDFAAKHGHSQPNSTDIHATRKIKNFKSYLIKYMTKVDDTRRKIEGKTWDCSRNLKDHKRAEVHIDTSLALALTAYIAKNETQVKTTDFCTLVFIKKKDWRAHLPTTITDTFDQWKETIRPDYKPPPPPTTEVTTPLTPCPF